MVIPGNILQMTAGVVVMVILGPNVTGKELAVPVYSSWDRALLWLLPS